MADRLTAERRSWNMSRIRSKNTGPERIVRSLLHRMGYRFRMHRKDLPGSPDLVLPRYKVVVFIHGCFWHRHRGCKFAYTPKSRITFWQTKFKANLDRDKKNRHALKKMGWKIITVWECITKDLAKLQAFLKSNLT